MGNKPHKVQFLHQKQSQPFDQVFPKFLSAYWNSSQKAYQHICNVKDFESEKKLIKYAKGHEGVLSTVAPFSLDHKA